MKEEERSNRRIACSKVALRAGMEGWARSLWEEADTSESWMSLGDRLADKREWLPAAECYRRAWRKDLRARHWLDPGDFVVVLPLYLAGDALVKAGRDGEGRRLLEQAHFALLGSDGSRYRFSERLEERGRREAARGEFRLAAHLAEAGPHFDQDNYHRASRWLARAAARNDAFQAAKLYEQALFSNLGMAGADFGVIGVLRMASEIHRLRAHGFLAADKHAEAGREIDLALNAWPANTEVAIALVPNWSGAAARKKPTPCSSVASNRTPKPAALIRAAPRATTTWRGRRFAVAAISMRHSNTRGRRSS